MDAPPGPPGPASPDGDGGQGRGTRLDSWKEIASYLNRDLRTVQRWEKHGNLPVRRLQRPGLRAVFAYTGELDEWLQNQPEPPDDAPSEDDAASDGEVPAPAAPAGLTAPAVEGLAGATSTRRWLRPAAAIVGVAFAGILIGWSLRRDAIAPYGPFRVQPVTADPSYDRDPAISPDGKFVAYAAVTADRASRIYVRLLDGGEPRALTAAPDDERSPAWSPDGTRIAFLRGQPEGTMTILITTPLGGQERPVGEVRPFAPRRTLSIGHLLTWTPDGRALVVADQLTPGTGQLWRLDFDTGERRALTTPEPDQFDVEPSFSSDGRLLLFGRVRGEFASDVFVQPLDADYRPAGAPRKLPPVALWNGTPRLLEDRGEVLLSAGSVPRLSLWRRRLDGTGEPVQVTSGSEYHIQADIHRPSGRIVSHAMRDQMDVLEYELPEQPSPSPVVPATRPFVPSTFIDRAAVFSPDGRRVAFISDRTGRRQLWVASANGEDAVEWTQPAEPDGTPPAWSPDGTRIAFSAITTSGTTQLFIASEQTRQARQLTSDRLTWARPIWSVDGTSLYGAAEERSTVSLYRVTVADGTVELLRPGYSNVVGVDPSGRGLYAVQRERRTQPTLVYLPLAGGEPVTLATMNFPDDASTTAEGVYYMERRGRTNLEPVALMFRSHAGQVRLIERYAASPGRGVMVSPDGRFVLTTTFGSWLDDLLLLDPTK